MNIEQQRRKQGEKFYNQLARIIATSEGNDLHGGRPFSIRDAKLTLGLRVCGVRVNCGLENQRLLDRLTSAIVPHLVPWKTDMSPVAYSDGRYVVVEAQWPDKLQRNDIRLSDVTTSISGRRLVVGQNQAGVTVTLPSHELEHVLVAGQTGSGKSYTLRSIVRQLCAATDAMPNQIVLIDGKGGEGLEIVNGVPGQVGPLAVDRQSTTDALGWSVNEMRRRYGLIRNSDGRALNGDTRHVFVVFDEFQQYTKDNSVPEIVALMNVLATQGRAAKIHVIAGTQKPLVSVFGDSTTADQFSVAVGGRVKSYHTSRAIMGDSTPRCDHLLPGGDAYVKALVPNLLVERVQVAYVPESELLKVSGGQPELEHWPEFDADELESERGRPRKCTSPEELAIGLEALVRDKGRPWFKGELENAPGSSRHTRIMDECGELLGMIEERGGRLEYAE